MNSGYDVTVHETVWPEAAAVMAEIGFRPLAIVRVGETMTLTFDSLEEAVCMKILFY